MKFCLCVIGRISLVGNCILPVPPAISMTQKKTAATQLHINKIESKTTLLVQVKSWNTQLLCFLPQKMWTSRVWLLVGGSAMEFLISLLPVFEQQLIFNCLACDFVSSETSNSTIQLSDDCSVRFNQATTQDLIKASSRSSSAVLDPAQ